MSTLLRYARKAASIQLLQSIGELRCARSRRHNVALLHVGRCGSSVLCDMLGRHSNVIWDRELFRKYRSHGEHSDESQRVRSALRGAMYLRRCEIYGFETKYLSHQHFGPKRLNMRTGDYLSILRALGFDKFIILERKNYLKKIASQVTGRLRGEWHSTRKIISCQSSVLDVNSVRLGSRTSNLVAALHYLDEQHELIHSLTRGDDVLALTYESDIRDDPTIAFEKVCRFLDIPSESKTPVIRRMNTRPLSEIFHNYVEVKQLLERTEYYWMLDE